MWWLWVLGPIAVGVIYLLTGQEDKRRLDELETWRTTLGPKPVGKSSGKGKTPPGTKRVPSVPGPLSALVAEVGGGRPIGYFELVPRLAYLCVMSANAVEGSDFQTVVAKLAKAGPTFTARPLPIVDGTRVANEGIPFKKDEEFAEAFLVEGEDTKAVLRWLTRPLRDALREMPDVWLSVDGTAMALTLFGSVDASRIDELVRTADAIFEAYGADGGPSLVGDDEDDQGDDEEADGDDDEEDLDDDEGDEEIPAPLKPAPLKAAPAAKPAQKMVAGKKA
jgi:hypothetical protein